MTVEAQQSPALLLLSRQKLFEIPLTGDPFLEPPGLPHFLSAHRNWLRRWNRIDGQ